MAAESAVTRNLISAYDIASRKLEDEAAALVAKAAGYRLQAARGGSLFSASRDTAAQYIIDALAKAAQSLEKSAHVHRQMITALRRAPCPACRAGHRSHCAMCGSCPGRDKGPSCAQLECETERSRVKVSH